MEMTRTRAAAAAATVLAWVAVAMASGGGRQTLVPQFRTSDRCVACHDGLQTPSGVDVSIGIDWRATMMANSSRDPYWRASVRREVMDHAESQAVIEDACTVCHMPITRYNAIVRGEHGRAFAHFPFWQDEKEGREAADGVSCSVCHQISRERLGTPESFNGGFVVQAPADPDARPEYGPFAIEQGHLTIMRSSSEGYRPTQSDHIRRSELCATCHTLITQALGPGGKPIGRLPEQVPYQEWLHSDFRATETCQGCHMPRVNEPAPITRVFGTLREGTSRHSFVAGNFFMLRMLNQFRDAQEVAALPEQLSAAADLTLRYLASQAARVAVDALTIEHGTLRAGVVVENLGGHKLPTAYPSRRAWLHVAVRDGAGRIVFESGVVNADGSVQGNDNDADRAKFEPHYTSISRPDQVQIYESIIGDVNDAVTTGLLTGVKYLKDNRLLPRGFDKATAEPDIAVHGAAGADADFVGGSDRVDYLVDVANAQGPFTIDVELLYQPIGFRWAGNLKAYDAPEPNRFTGYYSAMSHAATAALARSTRSTPR
jgi:hypothetical protein